MCFRLLSRRIAWHRMPYESCGPLDSERGTMSNLIITTTDGVLKTPTAEVTSLVKNAVASGKPVLIHIHGGLVGENDAIARADWLSKNAYGKGNLFPMFLIWKTSIPDALKHRRRQSELCDGGAPEPPGFGALHDHLGQRPARRAGSWRNHLQLPRSARGQHIHGQGHRP